MESFSCGVYYDRIGENVRRLRLERGITQEQLAEKAELSLTVIQKIEAGQSGSRTETLIRIALVLNVSLDFLVDIRHTNERNKAQQEAVYLLLKDKSVEEARYVVAVVDSVFKYKKQFLDDNHIRFNETPGAAYQDISFQFKVLSLDLIHI